LADNIDVTPGTGATVATDDISSVHYQVVKLGLGADGSLDNLVDSGQQLMAASVPVVLASNHTDVKVTLDSEAVAITGTVAVTQSGAWDEVGINDSGNSITVDNGGTFAVQVTGDALTALQILDNAISGSEMQVDVVAALPAGDAAIGRVKLTDGTDVADVLDLANANPLTVAIVDGSGDQITSFGGGTQYTEGATDATITGTALLWEDGADTLVTASAATPFPVEIVAGAGSGGTAAADDADFTPGTTSGTPAMGVYESAPSSVTDGDLGTVGITQTRALRTAVEGTVTVASHAVTNAGTFVVQVNGDALTALQTLDNAISGSEMQVDVVAALPAGTNNIGDVDVLTLPSIPAGTNNIGDVDILTIAAGDNNIGNVDIVTLPAITGTGTFVVQVDGNALTALQKIDDPVIVDDAAFTPATTSVMMAGFEADETATDSVDEGDGGAARMTLDRKQIVTAQPHTAGGLSISRDIDLDNSTLTVVKNSPGQVYGWTITNTTTAIVYVKFYDATSGTLGTGTPVLTIGIPGNATDDTTLAQSFGGLGIAFATGICVGAGTGVADADNTDPGANGVIANIFFK
jgi:hypothetical protein